MNPQLGVSTTPSSSTTTPSASIGARRFSVDKRYLAPLLITCILAAGQVSFGFLESYSRTALAIFVALAAELVVGRLFWGQWPHLASAYVSGISVGILVRSPAFWPYALGSLLSITSKYVLRVKGRHLWNPSNFGICAMLLLVPDTVASLSIQWGNYLLPLIIIWVLGSLIIWQVKRFHICATYVVSFLVLAYVRSWITGHPFLAEVAPITGPMYQLFIFFMITDPKTTVQTTWGQCVVAFLVAVVEMVLRLHESVYAPLYALFLVGPAANLIEIWWGSRRAPVITPG
ncbi:MAG TPA: RnfABCDGE type electron transport complex subunit D [Candidatus Tectomicrobia bacterium]|nr:RnfABCDGE type electron transport complex subunit D [Candidatus Tectomicrobia bacterium]